MANPDPLTETATIRLNGVSLAFRGGKNREPLRVLQQIELAVRKSELVAIVGPSGCGKTTLLRLIGGLPHYDSQQVVVEGSISVDGVPSDQARVNRSFGFAFQNPALLPWRNVLQNALLP